MDFVNGYAVSAWVFKLGIWPLLAALVLNMMFRRYGSAVGIKRMASLYHAIAVFIITTAAALITDRELSDLYFFGAVAITLVILALFRKKTFPYTMLCAACEEKLDMRTVYFMDDNLCSSCRSARTAQSASGTPETAEELADPGPVAPDNSEPSDEERGETKLD